MQANPEKHPADSRKAPSTTKPLGWYYIRCRIPADWEVTHFVTSEQKGRLEFNNRQGYQGKLSWEKCVREPDQERMIREFYNQVLAHEQQNRRNAPVKIVTRRQAGFTVGYQDPGRIFQASTFLEREHMLIRWVMPDFQQDKWKTQWRPILDSWSPNLGSIWTWAMFGLEFKLPRHFLPEEVKPYPANVTMLFESVETKLRATFHRWGLPEELLRNTDLKNYYHYVLMRKRHCRIDATCETTLHGMEAAEIDYRQRGEHHMDKMAGRRWSGRGWAWHNQSEKRIYAFEQAGPKKSERLNLDAVFTF